MMEEDLKKYLNLQDKSTLEEQIMKLYKLFPQVKEYYNFKMDSGFEKKVLYKCKKMIKDEFWFKEGKVNVCYPKVINSIREFHKFTDNKCSVVELMFYYIDLGLEFTKVYGAMEEKIYLSIEATFDKALNYIFKNSLENKFKNNIDNILNNICEIGFDFKDSMNDIYNSYYR